MGNGNSQVGQILPLRMTTGDSISRDCNPTSLRSEESGKNKLRVRRLSSYLEKQDLLIALVEASVATPLQESEMDGLFAIGNNCGHPKESVTRADVESFISRGLGLTSMILTARMVAPERPTTLHKRPRGASAKSQVASPLLAHPLAHPHQAIFRENCSTLPVRGTSRSKLFDHEEMLGEVFCYLDGEFAQEKARGRGFSHVQRTGIAVRNAVSLVSDLVKLLHFVVR